MLASNASFNASAICGRGEFTNKQKVYLLHSLIRPV